MSPTPDRPEASLPWLPSLPLRGTPPLPGSTITVTVLRPMAVAALSAVTPEEPRVLLLSQREAAAEPAGLSDVRPLGVLAAVLRLARDEAGQVQVALEARERVEVDMLERRGDALWARARVVASVDAPDDVETAARASTLKSLYQRLLALDPEGDPDLLQSVQGIEDAGDLADAVIARLDLHAHDRRAVLEELDERARLGIAVRLAGRALDAATLARRIEGEVTGRVEAAHRQSLLREQLALVRRELGMGNDLRVAALRERMAGAHLPEDVAAEVQGSLARLEDAGPQAPERSLVLQRIECLLALPWERRSRPPIDLLHVRVVLDRDHRGQGEAKARMLDALAPGVLRPDGHVPALCLVGPSGVGKSSLAEGLGEALSRPVVHVRLTGVASEADLWGQPRYIPDARPGRVLEALQRAGARDPVIVLDGLDELAMSYPGDLEGLVMPLLDPAARSRMEDRWLGAPFDLSAAVVVATAQVVEVLPPEIRDRLVEVHLRGYLDREKVEIARDHLVPALVREVGLPPATEVAPETLQAVVDGWTFESGVHGLHAALRNVLQRVAARGAAGGALPWHVRPQDLPGILGPRRRYMARVERSCAPGLAMGLAWTPAGGEVLFIEAAAVPGSGQVKLTGSLGEVMKESAEAAITWLREHGRGMLDPRTVDLHVHVPAGAVPKDGPSAGVALVVAIASALTKTPARHDLAMSGEITLRGQVLPVGGIREKVMAAPRAGIRAVVLPRANEQDLAEIPPSAVQGLRVHLVDRVEDLLGIALAPCEPEQRPAAGTAGARVRAGQRKARAGTARARKRASRPARTASSRPARARGRRKASGAAARRRRAP